MEKAIEISNLTFGYEKNILENLNLDIYHGDFLGIVGPNGTGKTTLLKIIIGQIKQSSGTVRIYEEKDGRKSVGYVKQMNMESSVSFPITPLEVVTLNLYNEMGIFKISNKKIEQEALNALSVVNLKDKAFYNYNSMSGGEQQRVLIAKALVNNPKILIFDEPTAGIDQKSKERLFNLLEHLNKHHNITIIMVTHEIGISEKYFNRIIELESGKIREVKEDSNDNI